jgi:hypothetical protein
MELIEEMELVDEKVRGGLNRDESGAVPQDHLM